MKKRESIVTKVMYRITEGELSVIAREYVRKQGVMLSRDAALDWEISAGGSMSLVISDEKRSGFGEEVEI